MPVTTIDPGVYSGEGAAMAPGMEGLIAALAKRMNKIAPSFFNAAGAARMSAGKNWEVGWAGMSAEERASSLKLWAAQMLGYEPYPEGHLLTEQGGGPLSKALAAKQAGYADYKLGVMRGGASGTVTSNITD